jgi:hypothetical protein
MWATEKAYHGTIHEEDWMLYHDALIVMTAQDCKDWMKTQPIGNKGLTFYDKWILPLHGLNDDISQFSAGNPSVTSMPPLIYLHLYTAQHWYRSSVMRAFKGLGIGRYAFGHCILLLCINIPSSVFDIDDNAFVCCYLLRFVTIPYKYSMTQEQFASSFPALHDKGITLDLIKGRFDELSLHRLCINYNRAPGTHAVVQSQCESFIQ